MKLQDVLGILLFIAIRALVCMYIWNTCIVGSIDGIHTLSYLKALGIISLIKLMQVDNKNIQKDTL